MKASIWLGWEPREAAAFAVARHSLMRRLSLPFPIHGLVLADLEQAGLYTRPLERRTVNGRSVMWDVISGAPMSTEHANARFLVPRLAGSGWALFMDCDVLVRSNLGRVFEGLDPRFAVYCVKHAQKQQTGVKMDGQVQLPYGRKNWSSFMIFNCGHPANWALTVEMVNTLPGRDLHRFCWLEHDNLIGELGPEWNWLVGESEPIDAPKVVHFTLGTPDMPGYEDAEYAEEWRDELRLWAAGASVPTSKAAVQGRVLASAGG